MKSFTTINVQGNERTSSVDNDTPLASMEDITSKISLIYSSNSVPVLYI